MTILTQVLKRVRDADFVRYINGKFLDKNNNEISVDTEPGGGSGDNTQDVINAANPKVTPEDGDKLLAGDSAAGGLLKYFSWLDFKTAIVNYLKILDFVRVNANKDLLSGSDVVVTPSSIGARLDYLLSTASTDPGSAKFNFDTLTPAAGNAVSFFINYFDKNGTDMSSYMDAWVSGGTLFIKSVSSTDTSYAVISIATFSDQDPDQFFAGSGTFIGGNTFSGGEACTIQYIPPTSVALAIAGAASKGTPVDADKLGIVDSDASNILKYISYGNFKAAIAAYLKTLGFVRIDGSGNLKDGSDATIDGVNTVYALVSKPVSGITPLPAANTVTNGSVVAIHPDCFVDGGNLAGPLLRAYVAGNVWRPATDRVLLYGKTFGTLASPTIRMTNTTQATSPKFAVPTDPVIPAGLLYAGCKLIIKAKFRRNMSLVGLGVVTLQCFLGNSATQTSNSLVWNANINDTDDFDSSPRTDVTFASTTSIRTTRNLTEGGTGLASAFSDLTAGIDTATDMFVTWKCLTTLDANNSFDLLAFEIEMVAQ